MLSKFKSYIAMLKSFYDVNTNEWVVAIRKKSNAKLFEGNFDKFTIVPNSLKYWYADPFLFTFDDEDYLFVEMYDRKTAKGSIGVARIRNGRCGKFVKIIETTYHLSYPFIFCDEKGIHMVPESFSNEKVQMYKCVKFPYLWEEETVISEECVVDSTRYVSENTEMWFATRFNSPKERYNDNLSVLSAQSGKFKILKSGLLSRPAGNFILSDCGIIIRPSQDCTQTYGGGLVFNRVIVMDAENYEETPFLKVYAPGCNADDAKNIVCDKKKYWEYIGIHTYNCNERYEVVDLKYIGGKSIYLFALRFKKYLNNKFLKK